MYVCTPMYVCTYVRTYIYKCNSVCMHGVCIHACMYAVSVYMCIYAFMYLCIYAYIYIYKRDRKYSIRNKQLRTGFYNVLLSPCERILLQCSYVYPPITVPTQEHIIMQAKFLRCMMRQK